MSLYATLAAAVVAAAAAAGAAAPAPKAPSTADILFADRATRDDAFRRMETIAPSHIVRRGDHVRALPLGRPLPALAWTHDGAPQTLERFMADKHVAGVMVLQDGRVRLERYGLGYGPKGRWTSFSVAKSITSTLVGAAVRDGYIRSIDDPITRYLPELNGSGYEGVSVRQVLTMTSGVKWNEDYTDPNSDVARTGRLTAPPGKDPTLEQMRQLPREAPPGSKWVYKTGETNLIGVLVSHATHRPLADYLSEKIWRPYGMEQDAAWLTMANGQEFGGCCLSMALHDYARFGQFMLEGARGVVPDGWVAQATRKQAEIGEPGLGYGFQWWTHDDGTYDALGIFGQLIHVDPARKLVVVVNADWAQADDRADELARAAFVKAVAAAADAR